MYSQFAIPGNVWNDGDFMDAAAWQTKIVGPLEDVINELEGDPTWLRPLTLGGGWSNYGSDLSTVAYRKIGRVVTLKGLVTGGAVGAANVIFTLPVGYRPSVQMMFMGGAGSGNCQPAVYPSGAVFIYNLCTGANNGYCSLSGMEFFVDDAS